MKCHSTGIFKNIFSFELSGIKPWVPHTLSKYSSIELHHQLSILIFKLYFTFISMCVWERARVHVCVSACLHVCEGYGYGCTCGGQRTIYRKLFFLFHHSWVPRTELKQTGVAKSAFTYWSIILVHIDS